MKRIVQVTPEEGKSLRLLFDDGIEGVCDLTYLSGRGVFSKWQDDAFFRSVAIGAHGGLIWPDGVDLCPDALYLKVTQDQPETLFPELRKEPTCA